MENRTERLFAAHPDKNTVYVTSDGFHFFDRASASQHGKTLVDKTVQTVHRAVTDAKAVEPEDSEADVPANFLDGLTVAEVEEWAASETDIATLQEALTKEYTPFKGAIKAIEKRIEQLNTPQE